MNGQLLLVGLSGWLKADVGVIYGGIKVLVYVGFNIDTRDDFLLVVSSVSEGGK
jgi:hypothetical protein